MSLLFDSKGWLSTLQDLGRPGYGHYGINRSGAMDPLALRAANVLLGQAVQTAALEFCFPAPTLRFLASARVCLSGADFGAMIQDLPIVPYRPTWVEAGSVLRFTHKGWGQYAYLSVQGGFDVMPWLGSQSTNLKAGVGGWQGRAFQQGDNLPFQTTAPAAGGGSRPYRAVLNAFYTEPDWIRYLPAPAQSDYLSPEMQQRLHEQGWRLGLASDRMGYRLEGDPLELQAPVSLLSAGLSRGSIQLPPSGLPIVLMADHQTTGGYPRLGQVIQADWPKLAQRGPGQTLRLRSVSMEEALDALRAQEQYLRQLAWSVRFG